MEAEKMNSLKSDQRVKVVERLSNLKIESIVNRGSHEWGAQHREFSQW